MEFVSFEDTTGIYETTFFPDAYRKFSHMLGASRPYVLTGRVESDMGALYLLVEDVQPLDREKARRPERKVDLESGKPAKMLEGSKGEAVFDPELDLVSPWARGRC